MDKSEVVKRRFVIGNWKCHKTYDEARSWFDTFAGLYQPVANIQVVVALPMIWLAQIAEHVKGLALPGLSLAAQDISSFPPGGYTGAIAADMLKNIAEYSIVGHSERRRYFHETSQDVVNKVSEAIDAGIKPIVCVDKPYAMSQLTSLNDTDCEHLIVAYCPVDAMSYREPEAPEKVEEAAGFISQAHPDQPIIYGGAINRDNAHLYVGISRVDGLFVGSASLDPESFNAICQAMNP